MTYYGTLRIVRLFTSPYYGQEIVVDACFLLFLSSIASMTQCSVIADALLFATRYRVIVVRMLTSTMTSSSFPASICRFLCWSNLKFYVWRWGGQEVSDVLFLRGLMDGDGAQSGHRGRPDRLPVLWITRMNSRCVLPKTLVPYGHL